jgi:hypothetical protein
MKRLLVLLLIAGCGGSDEGKEAPPPAKPPKPAATVTATGAVAALQPGVDPGKEALLAEVRKRQLSNDDFVESDSNRDPFHSYMSTFAAQVVTQTQHTILMEKFALDELKLIAIVGGEGTPLKAMFVEPSPPMAGVTVVRGDHISKSDALITRIAPDRVFVKIEEDAGNGKVKTTERVLELHAGEAAQQ